MKRKTNYFHRWLRKNPIYLWWLIFLPLMLLILLTSWEHLTVPLQDGISPPSFLAGLFQSFTLVVLARVVLVAVGVVIIMICLFFPLFRVSKEGVQWSREQEEELARVTGEITGAEVEDLIRKEALRWSLIHRWFHFVAAKEAAPSVWLREMVAMIGEAFPEERYSILLYREGKVYTLGHPLLPKLVAPDQTVVETLGIKLSFDHDYALYFYLYSVDPVGFSTVDEDFLLILWEIFGREVQLSKVDPVELVAYFELVINPTADASIK